jgi:hypothetical protein
MFGSENPSPTKMDIIKMAIWRIFLMAVTGISGSLGPIRMVMDGIFPGIVLSAADRAIKKRLPKMTPENSLAQK